MAPVLNPPSVGNVSEIVVDGKKIPGSFYIDGTNRSGQLILPIKLTLPQEATLFHSEDLLVKGTTTLDTKIHPVPPILMKLNAEGRITGEMYTLRAGILSQIEKPDNLTLSEAFVPCHTIDGVKTGIVTRPNISLRDVLA